MDYAPGHQAGALTYTAIANGKGRNHPPSESTGRSLKDKFSSALDAARQLQQDRRDAAPAEQHRHVTRRDRRGTPRQILGERFGRLASASTSLQRS